MLRVRYRIGKRTFYRRKKRIRRASIAIVLASIGVIAGIYIISIPLAPKFADNHAKEAAASQPSDNRVIIPSADINTPYFAGSRAVLHKGAWYRFPERGNPEKGGNFILAGHRFVMTGLHRRTMTESRFYNINKIKKGDLVIIHWNHKKYEYKVVRKYTVKPNQTEIENPSKEPKLTMYTCTLGGTYDGREVVEATQI